LGLDANWGESVLEEWRTYVLPKKRRELLNEFRRKVQTREKFTYDLSKRLTNEEIPKAIALQKKTSFSGEIRNIVRFRVTEAKKDILTLLSESKNPVARKNCLRYLMRLFPEDSKKIFARSLEDQNIEVRKEAIRALASIGDDKATQMLIEQLENPKGGADEDMALVNALAKIGTKPAVQALLDYTRRDKKTMQARIVSRKTLLLLGDFPRKDVVTHLLKVARDKKVPTAYWALALTGTDEAANWLRKHRKSAESNLYLASLASRAGGEDGEAEKRALQMLEGNQFRRCIPPAKEAYLRLLCRGIENNVENLLAYITENRMNEDIFEVCRNEFVSRGNEIKPQLLAYLKNKNLKHYQRGVEIAYWCLLQAEPRDEVPLNLLKRAYGDYKEARLKAVVGYEELRKSIAIYLSNMEAKKYKYTVMEYSPRW
jgi:hypothetical protein